MTLPSDESDRLNKEPLPQELGSEASEQQWKNETSVTTENIEVLQTFLRLRLGQLYSNVPENYSVSFGSICDCNDIDPSILTVQKIEAPDLGDSFYRATTTRTKTSIHPTKNMPEQLVCLHPSIQVGVSTFENVLKEILDTLEMLPENALQEFIETCYPDKMPSNLRVLPSHRDANIHSQYPGYAHSVEFHHFLDSQNEASTQFTRSQTMNHVNEAIKKAVNEYTLVLLSYSPENPQTIEVHKLNFDEATRFKDQLFEHFIRPSNLRIGTANKPSETAYTFVLDDAFGLQAYNNSFTEADIEHVRAVIREACTDFTTVWIHFRSETTTNGVIVKIYAK